MAKGEPGKRYEWHEECDGPICQGCNSCICEGGCRCGGAQLPDDEYIRAHGGEDLETGHVRDPEGDEAAHA